MSAQKTFAILNPADQGLMPSAPKVSLSINPPAPANNANTSGGNDSSLSIRVHETHSMAYQEKYKILHLIQKGGWGAVYAAEREDGSPVAMKFFGYSKNAPIHSYINNEILLMMALKGCSGAIQIQSIFYDRPQGFISLSGERKIHGLTESYPVIVMERASGMDLLDLISYNHKESMKPNSTVGKLTVQSLAILFKNLMIAVSSIHERGFIHRDLKLDNVLALDKSLNSRIKIIDFGTMISISHENEVNVHSRNNIVGTRELIAPETMIRREYSFKSDVWQAGCCLYNMVFMRTLPNDFITLNMTNTTSLYNRTPEQIDALLFPSGHPEWTQAPESLKALLRGMLELNPNKRFSVQEILEHPFTNLLDEEQSPNTHQRQAELLDKVYGNSLNRILFAQKLRKYYRDVHGQDSTDINQDNVGGMANYFFDLFDTNGDVVISKHELHDGVAKIYVDEEGITGHAVDELFDSIDTDSDGSIDRDEFNEFFFASVSTTTVSCTIEIKDQLAYNDNGTAAGSADQSGGMGRSPTFEIKGQDA